MTMAELRGKKDIDSHQFKIRLSREFLKILQSKAEQNGRSLNSEILARLRESTVREELELDSLSK
ncbi:Arc family DNA-binding protein [Vibrio navarrensis]|uniref:Arc family DNA-binding protein n=1 Tax=Vibrio navarrensis TaxID=29495 RepID=UPI003857CF2A